MLMIYTKYIMIRRKFQILFCSTFDSNAPYTSNLLFITYYVVYGTFNQKSTVWFSFYHQVRHIRENDQFSFFMLVY